MAKEIDMKLNGGGEGRKKRVLVEVVRQYTISHLTGPWRFKSGRLPGGGNALLEIGK